MNINIYKTKEELSDKLSNYIIKNHINSSIAISGGSSPKILFKTLSEKLKIKINIDTKFFWVDERCVSPDSEESNYKMTKENLFRYNIFKPENIFRIKGENDPEKELVEYNRILKKNLKLENNIPKFDLGLFGFSTTSSTKKILFDIFFIFGTPYLFASLTFLHSKIAFASGFLSATSINRKIGCFLLLKIVTSPACKIKSSLPTYLSALFTASPKPRGLF